MSVDAKRAKDARTAFKKAKEVGLQGCLDRWDNPNEVAFRMSYLKNGKDRDYMRMFDDMAAKGQHEWTINRDTHEKWYMGRPHIRQAVPLSETAPPGVSTNPEVWKTVAKEAIKIKANLSEKRKREAESDNAKGDLELVAKASRTSYESIQWKSNWGSSQGWSSWSNQWSKSDKDWSDQNIEKDKKWEPQTSSGASGNTEPSSSSGGGNVSTNQMGVNEEATTSKVPPSQFDLPVKVAPSQSDLPVKAAPSQPDRLVKAPPPTIKAAPSKPPPPCVREREARGDIGQQTIDRTTSSKAAGVIIGATLSSPFAKAIEVIPSMPTRPAPVWRPSLHISEPVQLQSAKRIGFCSCSTSQGRPCAVESHLSTATHRSQIARRDKYVAFGCGCCFDFRIPQRFGTDGLPVM